MSASTEVESALRNCENTSRFFILETKKGFYSIGSWKAKLIRWLHLQRFFGTVYRTDEAGLNSLEERVENLAARCMKDARESQNNYYLAFVSLSRTLHSIRVEKSNFLIKSVHQSVHDIASFLFLYHTAGENAQRENEQKEKGWFSNYGILWAEQFIDECVEEERESWKTLCEEKCRLLRESCPKHEREVLTAFFSRAKESSFSEEVKTVESAYRRRWTTTDFFKKVEEAARAFFGKIGSATSLQIANWLKISLEDIKKQAPDDALRLSCHLIGLMRQSLLPWRFKEILREYGRLIGKECKKPLEVSFEQACKSLGELFTAEKEFTAVMEGLIEQKGERYCHAVAQAIQPEQIGPFLQVYVEIARALFSTSAKEVVKGVLKEILAEQKNDSNDSLCDTLAYIFIQKHKERRIPEDFSVFAPILGSGVSAKKSSSLVSSSPAPKISSDQKEENIWPEAFQGIELTAFDAEGLLKIEKRIVSSMANEPSFCAYYGDILGKRIIERSRASKEEPYSELKRKGSSTYEEFLTKNFRGLPIKLILDSMTKVLANDSLARLDELVSNPSSWKEGAAFKDIANKLRQQAIDFCPALERVAENIARRFVEVSQETMLKYPVTPPLHFFYTVVPSFSQSIQAVINALGLQGNGQQYFIDLLNKHPQAREVIQWIEKAKKYTQEDYKQSFIIPVNVPRRPEQIWGSEIPREINLLSLWIPFFTDPQAINDSIFRSGPASVSVDGVALESAGAYSTNLARACGLADALYQKVPQSARQERSTSYYTAIGKLITFAAIEYDPGSIIPQTLMEFPLRLGISSTILYLGGSSGDPLPIMEKFVFRFGYSAGKFYVERDICYRAFNKENTEKLGWWHVVSRQEIDPLRLGEISVTFTSKQRPPVKGV